VVVYPQAWAVQEVLPASLKKTERRNKLVVRKNVSQFNLLLTNCIEKRRQEAGPTRVGKKKKNKGLEASTKLPQGKYRTLKLTVAI
jgi:hypothetical protein